LGGAVGPVAVSWSGREEEAVSESQTVVVHVEDEPGMRRLVALSLRGEPFTLVDAENVADGLAKCRQHRPRIVVVDLALPDGSGIDLAHALRADEATAAATLIALTGLADRAARTAASVAGFDLYITKPFSPAQLRSTIRSALALSAAGSPAGERHDRDGGEHHRSESAEPEP
jgi:two-component system KDP operon response regulator KdpE